MHYHLLFYLLLCFGLSSTSFKVDLVTTNDLHGAIAEQNAYFMNPKYPPKLIGGSGLYKYIKDNINIDKSLIVDAGNFFQGHPMSVIDSGKTMIDFMNSLEYTALVPGPDDFVYGAKNLNKLAELSTFPFLISNLKCNNCELSSENFKHFFVKEINGIKFGFIGIIDAELKDKVVSNNIKGITVLGIKKSLDYWIPRIKEISDVVIVLTSTGVPWDREKVYNEFIEGVKNNKHPDYDFLNAIEMGFFSENVDIIISGGISKGYRIPWVDPNTDAIIMQNYGNGTSFGHVSLIIEDREFINYDFIIKNNQSQSLLLDDFPPHSTIRNLINKKNSTALQKLYQKFIPPPSKAKFIPPPSKPIDKKVEGDWPFPKLGYDDRLDIITWNCEFFPIADTETILALSEAINDFDVDIIAFQEIKKLGWFSKLMDFLPTYSYIISDQSSFMHQAIIYKTEEFKFIRKVEPFAENDYNFAGRPPLRADLFRYLDSSYYSIINLHMKCCDSGLNRRKEASKMLYNYVMDDIDEGYSNFIILGDWNDDLKDDWDQHCFTPFLNDAEFHFVTSRIVNDESQATYPKEPYVSFLDHILVTESLLSSYSPYLVETIKMGEYMNGYNNYESLISDHLPVLLSFKR